MSKNNLFISVFTRLTYLYLKDVSPNEIRKQRILIFIKTKFGGNTFSTIDQTQLLCGVERSATELATDV
jgi:hypothetical protein